jgi:hypothetical protein
MMKRRVEMSNEVGTHMKVRRGIVALVVAALLVALTVAADGQSQERRIAKREMEGSWRVTVTPGQSPIPLPPSIESIVTYNSGGGLAEIDNLAVPGSFAGAGLGVREANGSREFNISFTKYLFTTQGQNQGSVRLIESIVRNVNDETYTGEGRLETLSPTGAVILVIPVTTRAERISTGEQ